MIANAVRCEALVVGSGPAGSAAATMLAQAGRDVLLIDKADFPREKPCGDGVLADASPELRRIGIWEQMRAAGFRQFNGIRIVAEVRQPFVLPLTPEQHDLSFVAPRTVFDTMLRDHAAACGAVLRRAKALGFLWEGGRIVGVAADEAGSALDIRARVVVAADGASSVLAARTHRNPPEARAVALRGYVQAQKAQDEYLHIHLFKALGAGYAWLFPITSHLVNVGIGAMLADSRCLDPSLPALLHDFVDSEPVRDMLGAGELHDVAAWQLNLLRDDRSRVLPGALLAGDAGGFVNAATGAGISNALLTGRLAGEVAAEALAAGDSFQCVLATYDTRSQAELDERMTISRDMEQLLRILLKASPTAASV